jgi:hypothetical protein
MGWTSFRLKEPVKNWFKNQWESTDGYKVLDSALAQRTTLYAAIQKIETGEVFCAVYLIRWSNEYFNFCYKDMTEHSGPCESKCPQRIFDLLTPLSDDENNNYAREWRKRVETLLIKRKELSGCVKIIKVENPIGFGRGYHFQYFKKVGRVFYAGSMEQTGVFDSITRVSGFNPTDYKYELIDSVESI